MISFVKYPPKLALCDNVMRLEVATDLPANTEGGVSIEVTLFDAADQILGADVLYPILPGSASMDMSEYIRSMMFTPRQFTFPEQGNIPWDPKTGLIKEYKIKCQEIYADAPSPLLTTIWLYYHYAVRGIIPNWIKSEFYSKWTSFSQWLVNEKAFLTFSPKTLVTTPWQMQKLFLPIWWVPENNEKLNLKVKVGFTDGTSGSFTTGQQTGDITQNTIIEFGVSAPLLSILFWTETNHPGKTAAYYTVTAMFDEIERSETRTYLLDYDDHLSDHQFIFANSPGGYDTFVATGIRELNSDFKFVNVSQQNPDVSPLADRKQLSVESSDVLVCRTGFMDAPMAEYMAEFFESSERYEVVGSRLIPIVLRDAKMTRKTDDENMFFIQFEYEHALTQIIEAEQ